MKKIIHIAILILIGLIGMFLTWFKALLMLKICTSIVIVFLVVREAVKIIKNKNENDNDFNGI